jgi:hypothetical protein
LASAAPERHQQETVKEQDATAPQKLLFGEKKQLSADALRWQECLICGVQCAAAYPFPFSFGFTGYPCTFAK